MNARRWMSGLALAFFVGVSPGCARPAAVPKVEGDKVKVQAEALQVAKDTLIQSTEAAQFRNALHLFTAHMNDPKVREEIKLSAEQREFLRHQVHLAPDELEEVESGTFRPLDAHYLESCFLFRDVARTLEKTGLPPLELARHALGWVCRQVNPDAPPGHSWVPSHLVVRRGFGTPSDRALAFLALLRQLHMEGCVLGSKHPLVGVLITEKSGKNDPKDQLYLFDVVYGQAVPGPDGKGIATLAQLRQQPDLLKAAQIPPQEFNKSEFYLNSPLTALAPRMSVLEELIKDQDGVVLYMDAARVQKAVAAVAEGSVRAGNPPPEVNLKEAKPPPLRNSSTRVFRWFFPPLEGGVDPTGRWQKYRETLLPLPQLAANFVRMRLLSLGRESPDLHPQASASLINQSIDLLTKFTLQPRDLMLRGQTANTLKRLDRVRTVLEDIEFANVEESDFRGEVAAWRRQANHVYLNEPAKVGDFWSQDQYFLALLQADEDLDLKRYKKRILTHIIFAASKEILNQSTSLLLANCLQEKAESLQAAANHLQVRGSMNAQAAQGKAHDAWQDTRSQWNKHVDRYTLTPQGLKNRLAMHQDHWEKGYPEAGNLHYLVRDWTTSCMARLHLARALEQEGQGKRASTVLESLRQDLASLPQDAELQKDLEQCLEAAKTFFSQLKNVPVGPILENQRLLANEFRAEGPTLKTLQHLVELRLQKLKG